MLIHTEYRAGYHEASSQAITQQSVVAVIDNRKIAGVRRCRRVFVRFLILNTVSLRQETAWVFTPTSG